MRVAPRPGGRTSRNGPDLVEEVARLRGYDQIPSVLPTAPGGRGLTASQRGVRGRRHGARRAGPDRGVDLPVRRRRRSSTGSATTPRTRDGTPCGWPTRSPTRRRCCARACSTRCSRRCGSTSRRGPATSRSTSTGLVVRSGRPAGEGAGAGRRGAPRRRRPSPGSLAAVPRQPRHVAIALAGDAEPAGPVGSGPRARRRPTSIGPRARARPGPRASSWSPVPTRRPPCHPGRCAALALPDGTVVGHAGELHPKVVAALDLPARTCAARARPRRAHRGRRRAGAGRGRCRRTRSPTPTSPSSSTRRSPPRTSSWRCAAGAGADLESVTLFDVYRGDQVEAGKKSLAYRLSFRSAERTLTTEQVSAARDAAIGAAGRGDRGRAACLTPRVAVVTGAGRGIGGAPRRGVRRRGVRRRRVLPDRGGSGGSPRTPPGPDDRGRPHRRRGRPRLRGRRPGPARAHRRAGQQRRRHRRRGAARRVRSRPVVAVRRGQRAGSLPDDPHGAAGHARRSKRAGHQPQLRRRHPAGGRVHRLPRRQDRARPAHRLDPRLRARPGVSRVRPHAGRGPHRHDRRDGGARRPHRVDRSRRTSASWRWRSPTVGSTPGPAGSSAPASTRSRRCPLPRRPGCRGMRGRWPLRRTVSRTQSSPGEPAAASPSLSSRGVQHGAISRWRAVRAASACRGGALWTLG